MRWDEPHYNRVDVFGGWDYERDVVRVGVVPREFLILKFRHRYSKSCSRKKDRLNDK